MAAFCGVKCVSRIERPDSDAHARVSRRVPWPAQRALVFDRRRKQRPADQAAAARATAADARGGAAGDGLRRGGWGGRG